MHAPIRVHSSGRLGRYLTVIVRWLAIALVVFVLATLAGAYITGEMRPTGSGVGGQLQETPAHVLNRAEPSANPSSPQNARLVTILVAGFLSVTIASFVEIIFLISRASERTGN